MVESDLLAAALRRDFASIETSDAPEWHTEPALRVIDCVLSLNRHYDRFVVPRRNELAMRRPELHTVSQLRDLIAQHASPEAFLQEELRYRHPSRARTLVAVVDFLLDVARDYSGGSELDRLEAWAKDARPRDYLGLAIPGFGLAGFQYLRMLFGAQTTKPDLHVRRYVQGVVGGRVTDVKALYLLEGAARLAEVPLRQLDAKIWERGARGKVQGRRRTGRAGGRARRSEGS